MQKLMSFIQMIIEQIHGILTCHSRAKQHGFIGRDRYMRQLTVQHIPAQRYTI